MPQRRRQDSKRRTDRRRKADTQALRSQIAALKKKLETQEQSDDDSEEKLHALYEDFTDNQEQIRYIIETASDAFIGMDQTGLIVDWNKQAEASFGWSRTEALGQPVMQTLIPKSYRDKFKEGLTHFLTTGECELFSKRFEMNALHRSTREFPVELTVWPLAVGNRYRFHAFVRDVSERKRLERLKNEFVTTVSHELRTPITIIREGVSQVLDGILGQVTEEQTEFLTISLKAIDRLTRIVNDLLDISKIEAGKVELKKELLDVAQLTKEVSILFEAPIEEKGLVLKCDIPTDVVNVYLDRDKITQVLTNLIANALKFTQAGHVKVSVKEEDHQVLCSVADTGKGIRPSEITTVFDKFRQFGREAGPGDRGTGLGLAISRGLVEMHKGTISVVSDFGKGTEFQFSLPKYTAREVFREYLAPSVALGTDQESRPLSVVVFNLNGFGALKKKMGSHDAQKHLSHWASLVSRGLRGKGDYAVADSPYILVLLAETGKDDALLAAGRIQQILEHDFSARIPDLNMNVECRVACFPEDGVSPDELLRKVLN